MNVTSDDQPGGTVGHIAGMLLTMRMWIHPRISLDHVTPAWFIPVVGNLLVPLAGVSFGNIGMSVFSFSVGIIMWLGVLPIVLLRLFTHQAMPFPLVAMAAATLHHSTVFGIFFLAIASLVIAWLSGKNVNAIARGGIFVAD